MSSMVGMPASQPPTLSGVDEFLRVARLLSDPESVEKTLVTLGEATKNAEEATAKAEAATQAASEQIAAAQAATELAGQKMLQAAKAQERADADTDAFVSRKRATEMYFAGEQYKLEAERANIKAAADANNKRVEHFEALCAAAKADAAKAMADAHEKTVAAQQMMDAAVALRTDYEARLEKLRAIQS